MELTKVKSSNIIAVGYQDNSLLVQYSGGTYAYENVDKKVYEGLMAAESKGKFMAENIKSKYAYRKIN